MSRPNPPDLPNYRVLSLLGQGGMGVVWHATQLEPRRQVAIKQVLHTGTVSRGRFAFEVEVLARLDHPAIARILEAGVSDEGPWFAMEFVEGLPLDEHVAAVRADAREVARLVARVADGVHHAHLNGVVHRDLKPANILVDAQGRPKILDFGVAGTVQPGARDVQLTRQGQLVGTPLYMSPEQASLDTERIDARADVYALGVVLYQLVSGQLPYVIDGMGVGEVLRAVREERPVPLSRRAPELAGDLEAICGKALEKDPDDRYASAAALASDLRAWLSDGTIAARPPTTTEQVRRFVRRNPLLVSIVGAASIAVLVAGAAAGWSAYEATRALGAAEQARQEAERARGDAAERASALTLLQARTELDRDPTRSRAWLATLGDGPPPPGADALAVMADEAGVAEDLLVGHGETVRAMAWHPSGTRIATAGYDDTVRLWDLARRDVVVLDAPQGDLKVLAWAPDGLALAAGGEDATVWVWTLDVSGAVREPMGLTAHTADVTGLSWSEDGQVLVSAGDDGQVVAWGRDGAERGTLVRAEGEIGGLGRVDGGWVVGAADGTVRRVSVDSEGARTLGRFGVPVVAVASRIVSDGGDDVAVGLEDGRVVRLSSTPTSPARATASPVHDGEIRALRWTRDGEVASVGRDGRLVIGDRLVAQHDGVARELSVDGSTGWVASGGEDREVWLIGVDGLRRRLRGHRDRIRSLAFDPTGRRLATASDDGTVRIWPVAARAWPVARVGGDAVWQLARTVADDGRPALLGTDGRALAWRVRWDGPPDVFPGPAAEAGGAAPEVESVASEGARRWAGLRRGVGAVVDLDTLEPLTVPFAVDRLAVRAGQLLASGDGSVARWFPDAGAGRPWFDLPLSGDHLLDVALVEGWAVVAAEGGILGAWRATPGLVSGAAPARTVELGADLTASLVADGRRVLVGLSDGAVLAWHPGGGPPDRASRHEGAVLAVTAHADGLASASVDGTVAWGPPEGPVRRVDLGQPARAVASVPQGLAVGLQDGRVLLLDEAGRPVDVRWLDVPVKHLVVDRRAGRLAAAGDGPEVRSWPLRLPTVAPPSVRFGSDGGLTAPWTIRDRRP